MWWALTTYDEDRCRVRKHRKAIENLAWLRRFTVGLLKRHPANIGIDRKRKRCARRNDFLLEVLMGVEV